MKNKEKSMANLFLKKTENLFLKLPSISQFKNIKTIKTGVRVAKGNENAIAIARKK